MTTQQIGYFIKLAEELNFTSVAREFFITQPTLSRQIVNLENELNTDLFIREHNSVKLTDAGRSFYEKIKPVFEQLIGIIKETQLRENRKNTLSIGVQEEQIISNSFMLAINRLRNRYPDLTVNILRSTTAELIGGLEHGKYDLVNIIRYPNINYNEDFIFLVLEKECSCMFIASNLVEEADTGKEHVDFEFVREYAEKYSILLPRPFTNIDEEAPKNIFAQKFGIRNDRIRMVDSLTPISIPLQVSSGLGISIGNQTNISQIDPQIKIFTIDNTDNSYLKGLFYKNNSDNQYTEELLEMVREEKMFFDKKS